MAVKKHFVFYDDKDRHVYPIKYGYWEEFKHFSRSGVQGFHTVGQAEGFKEMKEKEYQGKGDLLTNEAYYVKEDMDSLVAWVEHESKGTRWAVRMSYNL